MTGPPQGWGLSEVITHPLSPERKAQVEAFERAQRDLSITEREICVANAWLFCTCRPTFAKVTLEAPPGHAGCLVHGQFMITYDGRVL